MTSLLRSAGAAALALVLVLAACTRSPEEKGVVAKVNGRPITLQQLEMRHSFSALSGPGENNPTVARLQEEYGQVLGGLVVLELVAQSLEKRGIPVADEELGKAEAEIRADYPEGAFEQVLVEEYIDLATWRQQLRSRLAVEKFFREVLRPEIKLDYQEAEAYYKEHIHDFYLPPRVRFVMLRGPSLALVDQAVEALGQSLDLAAVNEKLPQVQAQDLKMREDRLPSAWRGALKGLDPGQASQSLADRDGFTRLILLENTPAKVLDPSRAYPLVEKVLVEQKLGQAFDAWLTAQLATADIRVTPLLSLSQPQSVQPDSNATAQ
ncbi:MAG: peptidylprolyl isomerase [Thermodesulfobacteriota bacterium]